MGSVNDLSGTDGGQVAVALIGEDQTILGGTLDTGSDSGSAAMGSLVHIAVKIIVGKHRAANGSHADDLAVQVQLIAQFVDDLGHQTVDDTVVAAGAVMELLVGQILGLFKQNSHLIYPPSC